MSQFLGTGEFEVIVLYMEVSMVNDYHYAHKIIFPTSKATWGKRLQCIIHAYWSKIKPMTKWPLSSLDFQNVTLIWYFNKIKLIWDIRGHIGLKQPRICKFNFGWAWANFTLSRSNKAVDFINGNKFENHTDSET